MRNEINPCKEKLFDLLKIIATTEKANKLLTLQIEF